MTYYLVSQNLRFGILLVLGAFFIQSAAKLEETSPWKDMTPARSLRLLAAISGMAASVTMATALLNAQWCLIR